MILPFFRLLIVTKWTFRDLTRNNQISHYQLQQVEAALSVDGENCDLKELKENLEEVISLTQGKFNSLIITCEQVFLCRCCVINLLSDHVLNSHKMVP